MFVILRLEVLGVRGRGVGVIIILLITSQRLHNSIFILDHNLKKRHQLHPRKDFNEIQDAEKAPRQPQDY